MEECLDEKLNRLIRDEADLPRPLAISLVIPTKIDVGRKTRELELDVLKRVLSECSKLIDLGYLDEIVVVDGSTGHGGRADFSTLNKVVETAYEELDLFRKQIRLLRGNRTEAMNAKRGSFDFIVRTVHQFDENLFHVLEKFGLPKKAGIKVVPQGKGAALWLALPMTKGDVLCFLDSDIMNFVKEFAVSLCHPIVENWGSGGHSFTMIKAHYDRLTMTYEPPYDAFTFGGRVTRLFSIPLLRILTKEFPEVFEGFDSVKCPLSGEFSARRDLLENIYFPSDYSVEFSTLNQSMRKFSPSVIGQVDLETFFHIGQSVRGLDVMISQITNRILRTFESEGIGLSKQEKERIVLQYRKETLALLPEYWNVFSKLQNKISIDKRLNYSRETDLRRFRRFYRQFRSDFLNEQSHEQLILPSWHELSSGINYFVISSLLRRRSNQSTFLRLSRARLL